MNKITANEFKIEDMIYEICEVQVMLSTILKSDKSIKELLFNIINNIILET